MATVSTTNRHQIPLSVALWLMVEDYVKPTQSSNKNISVTGLLKSVREIVLTSRASQDSSIEVVNDLSDSISAKFGSLLHKGVEDSWIPENLFLLSRLGIPESVVKRIAINPAEETEDMIPIYLEQRSYKNVNGWTVSGKYDFVFDGQVQDLKTTSVFKYMTATNENDFMLQASLYRWLNPEIITKDDCAIIYLFTDWKQLDTYKEGYPKIKIASRTFNMKTYRQTETYVTDKLQMIDYYTNRPESELPLCTDAELWMGKSQYKYYKSGKVAARSTATRDTRLEAEAVHKANGSVGIIVESKDKARKCNWCSAAALCSQRASLEASGMLQLRKIL